MVAFIAGFYCIIRYLVRAFGGGTPWSGAIQNSGLIWIEMRSFQSNPECNKKLVLLVNVGLHKTLTKNSYFHQTLFKQCENNIQIQTLFV